MVAMWSRELGLSKSARPTLINGEMLATFIDCLSRDFVIPRNINLLPHSQTAACKQHKRFRNHVINS